MIKFRRYIIKEKLDMIKQELTVGLLPMRRNTTDRPRGTAWTWSSAEERGHRFVSYIKENFSSENIKFVDTEGLGIGSLIFDGKTAEDAIAKFKAANVDAVLMINTNFGNEEAAGDIARELGKPFAIWAPLDDEYYVRGMRTTDSQCGIFGISRQLQRYKIPFTFIPSCRVESDKFKENFECFLRTANMVKSFSGMRIGQIGTRPAPFYSVIINEGELMNNFGLKIIPINLAVLQDRFDKAKLDKQDEIAKFVKLFREGYKMDAATLTQLEKMACLAVTYIGIFEEFKLDVMSSECWTATPLMFDGLAPCAVYSILNDLGYVISCESDIHCAMTMRLLEAATFGKKRPFLGEFTVRHPENDNAELLWHCGPFPLSVKAPDSEAELVNQRVWLKARDGKYTLARIDQENGNYMILAGTCKSTDGPETYGTYLWAEFDNLDAWERRIVEGPYIHHFAEVEGDYTREITEFCKYIPALHRDEIK